MSNGAIESAVMDRYRLEQSAKSGARWFYWIAGLSAFNTASIWLSLGWSFFMGLGVTQFFDAFGSRLGVVGAVAALASDVAVVCIFALLGYLAHTRRPAYLVGIGLYALDGLLVLAFGDMLAAGFHVLAIVFMFQGYKSARTLAAAPAAVEPVLDAAPVEPAAAEGPPAPVVAEAPASS